MKNPVKRVVAIALMAAMLFSCIPGASAYYSVVTYEDEEVTSRELAKIVAEEGMILLKNEPVNEGEKAPAAGKGRIHSGFRPQPDRLCLWRRRIRQFHYRVCAQPVGRPA